MASNIFARYIWLIDTIRRNGLITFEKINERWRESELSFGEDLPLRTFHNHRKAIEEIFDVNIECNTKAGYKYYIANPERLEKDNLRMWLIDSFATLNQIKSGNGLKGRIKFDDNPSGRVYLAPVLDAMSKDKAVIISHRKFGGQSTEMRTIEPYFIKIINRRWYIIARDKDSGDVCTFGLDRISSFEMTDETFHIPEDFSIDEYFEGCCGIITDKDIPIERIVIRAYGYARDYFSALPVDPSQKEISRDEDSITYEFHLRPTIEFIQIIMSQVDQAEVLEPSSLRDKIHGYLNNALKFYED